MRTAIFFVGFATVAPFVNAADFSRASSFASLTAFVAAAKDFRPATTKSDLSPLFTVREMGQSEDPKTGTPVAALETVSSAELWSNDTRALIFVTAEPPTEATRSCVGVLFLLALEHGSWRIADLHRFSATGKYAAVSAVLTAHAGTGYHLGGEKNMPPVITIKEDHGGRGYSYDTSASFTLDDSKLKRLDLE